ncbi:HesA/MoeB/ThiF family protein [Marinimicrobium sp. ARAG 43.8]|uniref:HesA/MoeB/ThiF family protein n=1 Tax=Marinimicrobium sp. ARAG 43.8 TaxID=3418719 RepID=UPI003CFBBBD7
MATDISVIRTHFLRLIGRHVKIRSLELPGFYVKLKSYPDIRIPDPAKIMDWLTPHLSNESSQKLMSWIEERGSITNRWIVLELPGNEGSSTYCLNLRSGSLQPNRGPRFGLRSSYRTASKSGQGSPKLVQSSTVDILDRSTILSRDLHGIAQGLDSSHVILVGVGSLGGAVAAQLARAGVGRITLIDPEILVSENIGRHVLGADDLGKPKAYALRNRILKDLPTAKVEAYATYAEAVLHQKKDLFEKANLVIVTTADWESEVALWRVKSQGAIWGLLHAWSEPYTQVGHALFAPSGSPDARYLFEDNGNFLHKYTEWPEGGVVPLPACGESFIPGGSLGMTNVASMVSQSALRVLSRELSTATWITTIYRPQDVAGLGGRYLGPPLPDGVQQSILERRWPDQMESVA